MGASPLGLGNFKDTPWPTTLLQASHFYRIDDTLAAEEALEHQGEFLRNIIDTDPNLIFVKDWDGNFMLVNQAMAEIYGTTVADLTGKSDRDFNVTAEELERFLRDDRGVIETQRDKFIPEEKVTAAEGSVRWLETVKRPMRLPDGTVCVLGIAMDISGRKTVQEELIRQQEQTSQQRAFLRQVIDAVPNFIFVRNANGEMTLANQATADWFDLTVEQVVGKRDVDLAITPEDLERFRRQDREVLETGQDLLIPEEKVIDPSGAVRWGQTFKRRLISPDGIPSVLMVATDITERKRLQGQVTQSEKLAALGELVAGVAHEINNPLAAILGNAELLEMHADPQVREDAQTIIRMSQRATQIVRSLLTFARSETGARRQESLNALVQSTVEMTAYKLRKANVALVLGLQEPAPEAAANANEIQQIILNLINNAEHALRQTEGAKRLTITTATAETNGTRWATVSVADGGPGISEDILGRIFDPFFTTKGVGEGTGLGLSICHGIAQAHGGELTVTSTVGEGTTFTLAIPQAASGI